MSASPPPDGIGADELRRSDAGRHRPSPLGIVAFGVVVALGLTGVLGHERDWVASEGGTELAVHGPEVIRNGEFFELRVMVSSSVAIEELVIGVDAAYWEDMTVNTMIPAATEETSADGEFRFTFGELSAGEEFLVKVDLQVNPDIVIGNAGAITIYDGERELTSVDLTMTVLP